MFIHLFFELFHLLSFFLMFAAFFLHFQLFYIKSFVLKMLYTFLLPNQL